MLTVLLTVALLHWIVLVTPGANVLLVSQLAASGHRGSACYAGLGVTIVAVTWATLALLGVHALFTSLPGLRFAVQIAGGVYLCYVAVRLWRCSTPANGERGVLLTPWAAFQLGFLTNILNPKSALFFGSVFATALPPEPATSLLAAATGLVFFNALIWHTFLAIAFSQPRVQRAYARYCRLLNRVAATLVGIFGVRLVAAVANEIKSR